MINPTLYRLRSLAKTTPENLKESLQKEGVTVTPHPYLSYAFWIQDYDHLSELESFQKGEFYVQDISSMLVGELATGTRAPLI